MRNSALLVLAFLCVALAGAAQADDLKIAVVDMALVMKAYPETRSSRLILEQQLEEFESEQQDMLKEREGLEKVFRNARLQAENTALSDEARQKNRILAEEKLSELREREREIRETATLRRKQLNDQQARMRRRIVKKLRKIIKGYCEENKITLVLDSALPGSAAVEAVVYSAEHLDITEKVLGLIRKESGKAGD